MKTLLYAHDSPCLTRGRHRDFPDHGVVTVERSRGVGYDGQNIRGILNSMKHSSCGGIEWSREIRVAPSPTLPRGYAKSNDAPTAVRSTHMTAPESCCRRRSLRSCRPFGRGCP
jgi:hypothetical protein